MYIDEEGYDWLTGSCAYGYFYKKREENTVHMRFAGNYDVIIFFVFNLIKQIARYFDKNACEVFAEIGLRGGFIKEDR